MVVDQFLPVTVEQLTLGLPLRYDAYSQQGDLLASAGTLFDEATRNDWLERGLEVFRLKTTSQQDAGDEFLLRPHDAETLKRLQNNLDLARSATLTLAARLEDRQHVRNSEFQDLTSLILKDIQADNSAALLSLLKLQTRNPSANDAMTSDRCSQLSLLSMVIASELGWDEIDCQLTGMAGLLHDVSLIGIPEDISEDDAFELYYQHPLKSAYMVEGILGIDNRLVMAISQVHETLHGDGFPRRFRGKRILPLASVVHVADAYLTLTSPRQPKLFCQAKNLVPSDGIGYLMYHAAKGQYEVEMIKALIRATSLYPIGSRVRLSNDSAAKVLRSSIDSPSLPIVEMEDNTVVDLRSSQLKIVGPCGDKDCGYNRLKRSEIDSLVVA